MINCFWFCFGPVLAFSLLPSSIESCFGIDFGLLFRFGFHSASVLVLVYVWFYLLSLVFCFELCLLRFCFSLQLLFRFYFEYCDSIVFQIVVLSCFHSRSHLFVFNVLILFLFRIPIRLCSASKYEGEKGRYV